MNEKCSIRLPAEWEPHKSTLICWPHEKKDWPDKFMPIPWVYTEIIKKILPGENVRILIQAENLQNKIINYLKRAHVPLDNVEFIVVRTDRGWMRDISPAFIKSGSHIKAVRFLFNGWAKYANYHHDNHVSAILLKHLHIDMIDALYKNKPVVLEGGAFDVNGKGTMIITEECLLDPNIQIRNPGLTRSDYETIFREYLGISNVIWLKRGIRGDDTHGHVDDLCRFVSPDTLLLCREKNRNDANYEILEENFRCLHEAVLETGIKPNVIELPMPVPLIFQSKRLPASYANFYIANHAVLVPTFNDPNDRIALNTIQKCFPDREVVGIHSVDLVWGLGTIHCLTHEEPL